MGKTRDFFKKIRDTKGTYHAQMTTINTEMVWTKQKQAILSRGGKNLYRTNQKDLHDPDNHDGVISL